jgi:hypothetical protein
MKCGHAANSIYYHHPKLGDIPACVICDPPESITIDDNPPDLTGRKARCYYYGQRIGRRGDCDYPRGAEPVGGVCMCEADSDPEKLPFFEHHPNKPFDEFYCGCAYGWD